ncbi:hypothetical protein VNO78_17926 [Psophocarpus tetragonolobus]|uniref:Uncharacterized protein n=1 Tax=Psophocarpus tetragonolobus TaxID=3891 RepID=A0AAN9SHF7_PSOTE
MPRPVSPCSFVVSLFSSLGSISTSSRTFKFLTNRKQLIVLCWMSSLSLMAWILLVEDLSFRNEISLYFVFSVSCDYGGTVGDGEVIAEVKGVFLKEGDVEKDLRSEAGGGILSSSVEDRWQCAPPTGARWWQQSK